ncbi:hypothetical protein BJ508DRAFT_35257 [Ascobolus immersus RN42]|uniref:Uncharacterized protein n=1 Tax=Ascobolus immersus RN42 TaxID=1160509 RepID=A0A3N4HMB2_ASCIM|nr:hypothetical protein BJ508DRAFT_35257 [Ascobolus immersus RN42]
MKSNTQESDPLTMLDAPTPPQSLARASQNVKQYVQDLATWHEYEKAGKEAEHAAIVERMNGVYKEQEEEFNLFKLQRPMLGEIARERNAENEELKLENEKLREENRKLEEDKAALLNMCDDLVAKLEECGYKFEES